MERGLLTYLASIPYAVICVACCSKVVLTRSLFLIHADGRIQHHLEGSQPLLYGCAYYTWRGSIWDHRLHRPQACLPANLRGTSLPTPLHSLKPRTLNTFQNYGFPWKPPSRLMRRCRRPCLTSLLPTRPISRQWKPSRTTHTSRWRMGERPGIGMSK